MASGHRWDGRRRRTPRPQHGGDRLAQRSGCRSSEAFARDKRRRMRLIGYACCRATTLRHVMHLRPRYEHPLPSYCPQWSQIVLARFMGRWWRARDMMKRRGISRLQGLKSGARPPRLRFCAIALLAAAGLSACSSSEPPSASSLVEPDPPAAASPRAMGPKVRANPAVSASEATSVSRAAPGQIAGFRSSMVILYSSDVGTDGKKVAVSTLSLPTPIVAMSASKQRLAIHTGEGIRWVAITDVVVAAQPPTTPVAPRRARPISDGGRHHAFV